VVTKQKESLGRPGHWVQVECEVGPQLAGCVQQPVGYCIGRPLLIHDNIDPRFADLLPDGGIISFHRFDLRV